MYAWRLRQISLCLRTSSTTGPWSSTSRIVNSILSALLHRMKLARKRLTIAWLTITLKFACAHEAFSTYCCRWVQYWNNFFLKAKCRAWLSSLQLFCFYSYYTSFLFCIWCPILSNAVNILRCFILRLKCWTIDLVLLVCILDCSYYITNFLAMRFFIAIAFWYYALSLTVKALRCFHKHNDLTAL